MPLSRPILGKKHVRSEIDPAEEREAGYGRTGPNLVYREKPSDRLQLLTDRGWLTVSGPLNKWLSERIRTRGAWMDEQDARERQLKASVMPQKPEPAPRRPSGWRAWSATSLMRHLLSPPLGYGSPRWLDAEQTKVARGRFREELRDAEPVEDAAARIEREAEAGWEQGRQRLSGIERRAAYFLALAGVGGGFLLAASGLVVGEDAPLHGVARTAAVVALVLTVAGLGVSVAYASAAAMWAFGRLSPDITNRVIERSKQEQTEARLTRAAALMASRRRASIVAAWKLARLKRAAFAFAVAVVGVLLALAAVVGQALSSGG